MPNSNKWTVIAGIGLSMLILPECSRGQGPVITVAPTVDNIGRGTARVVWAVDRASTVHHIRWGLASNSYPNSRRLAGGAWKVVAGVLNGLPSETPIYLQVCSTASSQETCSAEISFTSGKVDSGVSLPEPPFSKVNPDRPAITGTSRTVGPNCEDPSTGLIALWNASQYGDEIVIPVTTVCAGRYVFPRKTYPGAGNWIVVRSGGQLPPEGVRITPEWESQMAKIVHSSPAIPVVNALTNADCDLGRLVWLTPAPQIFKLRQCRVEPRELTIASIDNNQSEIEITFTGSHGLVEGDRILIDQVGGTSQANGDYVARVISSRVIRLKVNGSGIAVLRNANWTGGGRARRHTWVVPANASGPSLPSGCSVNSWFVVDGSANIQTRTYWCTQPDVWERVLLDNTLFVANGAVFDFYSNGVNGVWLRGLYFTTPTIPDVDDWTKGSCCADFWLTGNNMYPSMVATGGSLVVYEQNAFKPHKLTRQRTAVTLGGDNSFFVDNWVENLSSWRAPVIGSWPESLCSAVEIAWQPGGPMLIKNNYISAMCVASVFIQDSQSSALAGPKRPHDVWVLNNEFVWPEEYRVGSPEHQTASPQRMASARHHIEFKSCRRCVIEGNIFRSTWASVNQAAAIALSSQTGSGYNATCTGGSCVMGYGFDARAIGEKMVIADEIVTVTGLTSGGFTVDPPITASGNAYSLTESPGVYNVLIRNNIFENVTMAFYGIAPTFAWNSVFPLGPLYFGNNLVKVRPGYCGLEMRGPNDSYTGYSCSSSCTKGAPCWGTSFYHSGPSRDWTIEHNTFAGTLGLVTFNYENGDLADGVWKARLRFEGNVAPVGTANGQPMVFGDYQQWGVAMLNRQYADASWDVRGNVWYGSTALPSGPPWGPQPAGNMLHRTDQQGPFPFDESFRVTALYRRGDNCSGQPCTLSGRDVGADVDSLLSVQGQTMNAEIIENASGQAKLRYTAPEGSACAVEWGTSYLPGSGMRIAGTTGVRDRTVTLAPVTPGETYHWRVLCSEQQPRGSFIAR